MLDSEQIKLNIQKVQSEINEIVEKLPDKQRVYIVAASKTMPIECIKAVENTAVFAVAENKAQEFRDKYLPLDGVEWQFIGRLQTNKVKYLVGKASLIQSVDSFELLNEIQRLAQKAGIIQDVLLEISVAGEEQKGGIKIENVKDYLNYFKNLSCVRLKGFMSVMPNVDDEELLKSYFIKMKELFDETGAKNYVNVEMKYLSCGMSHDYRIALKCGANMIRLGRTIFGERNYQ